MAATDPHSLSVGGAAAKAREQAPRWPPVYAPPPAQEKQVPNCRHDRNGDVFCDAGENGDLAEVKNLFTPRRLQQVQGLAAQASDFYVTKKTQDSVH